MWASATRSLCGFSAGLPGTGAHPPSVTQHVWEGAEPRLRAVMEGLQQRANEGQPLPRSMGVVARRESGAARAGARRLKSPAYPHQEPIAPSGATGNDG